MASTTSALPPMHHDGAKMDATGYPGDHAQYNDIEKGNMNGGGAPLGRQFSVQLSAEQFEKLYLQPGGTAAKGDLAKRLANPTPLGVASFLLCLTPFSCLLMGFGGATAAGAPVQVGAYYFIGGVGLYLAGVLEWIIGNTFPATVFCTFGGFWFAFGFLQQPLQEIATAVGGGTTVEFNAALGIYLAWWGCLTFIYLIASLRTNVVFVLLFAFLDVNFWCLVAVYFRLAGNSKLVTVPGLLKAAGAFGFLTSMCGWYLLVALLFGTTGVPISIPVGDLSNFMSGKKKVRSE